MSQPTPGNSHDSPHSEPLRIAKACLACRNRKTRCDGERPACRGCRKQGIAHSCNYDWVNRRHLKQMSRSSDVADAEKRDFVRTEPMHAAPRNDESTNGPESDAIPVFAGNNDNMSYGAGSMVSFLRHLTSNADQNEMSKSLPGNRRAEPSVMQRAARSAPLLPRRSLADDFVFCFFEYYHPVFPVLNRHEFQRQYDQLWSPSGQSEDQTAISEQDEAAFAAIVNLVFGIGSRISQAIEPEEKRSVPETFYHKARELYPYDILASGSFPALQMLLLLGLYLQATQRSAECWNSIGLAVRVAQSLGLHDDRSKHIDTIPSDVDLRRQVWHLCIQMDRLSSIAFGRPLMIESTTVPLPRKIDGEQLEGPFEAHPPHAHLSRFTAFVKSSFLMDLLNEIVRKIYSSDEVTNASRFIELLSKVMDLSRRLDEFTESLPIQLRYSQENSRTGSQDGRIRLQQEILHRRILYIKICLFRPFIMLSTSTTDQSTEPVAFGPTDQSAVERDLVRQYCQSCLQTAYQLASAAYNHLGDPYCSTGWHTTHFTFCSAMVLLSAFKSPYLHSDIGSVEYETSWDHCMAVLEFYSKPLRAAANGRRILLTLRKQLDQALLERGIVNRNNDGQNANSNSVPGVAIPATDDSQFMSEYNTEILDWFNIDNITDAWMTQFLPELEFLDVLTVP